MTLQFWVETTVWLMAASAVWYIPLIFRGQVHSPPAAWIIATVAINLAFATYWAVPGRSLEGNIGGLAAAVQITVVATTLLLTHWWRGTLRVSFDRFQYISLAVSAAVVVFWQQPLFFTEENRALWSFVCVQVLLMLSYVVFVHKVLKYQRNPDSIVFWTFILAGSVSGYFAADLKEDPLGLFNGIRGILSSVFLLCLMVRFDIRNGELRKKLRRFQGLLSRIQWQALPDPW